MSKAQIHTVYKTEGGKIVPPVSEVLKLIPKPALLPAAVKLTKDKIDYRKYWGDLRDVGSLAHEMILCHLRENTLVADDYSRSQIDRAENCFLKYLEWEKQHKLEPILIEKSLVSKRHRFGGTLDFYGNIDGILTLIDFKTGKAIYPVEHFCQIAAYNILLVENGYEKPRDFCILQIGRDETEKYREEHKIKLTKYRRLFLSGLKFFKSLKDAEKEK